MRRLVHTSKHISAYSANIVRKTAKQQGRHTHTRMHDGFIHLNTHNTRAAGNKGSQLGHPQSTAHTDWYTSKS